jgi:hypothetical protein
MVLKDLPLKRPGAKRQTTPGQDVRMFVRYRLDDASARQVAEEIGVDHSVVVRRAQRVTKDLVSGDTGRYGIDGRKPSEVAGFLGIDSETAARFIDAAKENAPADESEGRSTTPCGGAVHVQQNEFSTPAAA